MRAVHVRITAVYPRTDVQVQARSIVFKGGGGQADSSKNCWHAGKKNIIMKILICGGGYTYNFNFTISLFSLQILCGPKIVGERGNSMINHFFNVNKKKSFLRPKGTGATTHPSPHPAMLRAFEVFKIQRIECMLHNAKHINQLSWK